MKLTVVLLLTAICTSCSTFDPEYAEFKKQKETTPTPQQQVSPFGTAPDPYGVPAANPYGTPTPTNTDVGRYTPQANAPYQPLPGVPTGSSDPYAPTGARTGFPTIPSPSTGPTTPHVVVKGDSLWAIGRQYGASVDSIKQANGLTGDNIILGSTLQIPHN